MHDRGSHLSYLPADRSYPRLRGAVPFGCVQLLGPLCALLLAACAHTEVRRAEHVARELPMERSGDPAPSSDGTTTSPGGSCSHGLRLEGMLAVPTCPENGEGCRYGRDAVNAYAEHIDSPPHEFSVLVASSPWRFYSGDGRILTIEALTTGLRTSFKPEVREVVLYASWSGVAPEAHVRSLARQVSDALDGFPVRGLDGFMWLDKNGVRFIFHARALDRDLDRCVPAANGYLMWRAPGVDSCRAQRFCFCWALITCPLPHQ